MTKLMWKMKPNVVIGTKSQRMARHRLWCESAWEQTYGVGQHVMTPAQIGKWFTELRVGIRHNFPPFSSRKLGILNDFNAAFLNRFACRLFSHAAKIRRRYMNLFHSFLDGMDNTRTPLRALTFFFLLNQNGCMPNRGFSIN